MISIYRKFEENKVFWCVCLGVLCVAARLAAGAFSMNYGDFVNEIFTGELAASGRNVYAEQRYYNYGPAFFIMLGWLYRIAFSLPHSVLVYKSLLVLLLTVADFFTARLVAKKSSLIWGLVFFLNPLSFLTVSYLSQFDGLAVAFAAYGISYLEESAETKRFTMNDAAGVILLSLSLITKHIMWALPLWFLLNSKIHKRKRFLYAFVPVLLFLLSFVPYWSTGHQGIISNVFFYRSRNNLPLFGLDIVHRVINHLPIFSRSVTDPYGMQFLPFHKYIFAVYGLLMMAGAYIFRHEDIENNFLLYTISVVCFSSAISTQYLSIPCMALMILFRKKSLLYFPLIGTIIFGKHLMKIVMIWALLLYLIDYCKHKMSC